MSSPSLTRYAWLSIAAAIATILLKGVAWRLTGSVGLLSDAIESFVNLAGALMALWMLTLAAQPADDDHAYGHGKAEYFSSAFEGFLILLAAISIGYAAIERLLLGHQFRHGAYPDARGTHAAFDHPGGRCTSSDDRCMDLGRGNRRRRPGLAHRLALG
jgi:divalent metal cation (Fe/Co/Zn/Cd) transporter